MRCDSRRGVWLLPALAISILSCAHERTDWVDRPTSSERDAQRAALQAVAGLGSMLTVSGTAAGAIALFERDNGCLESQCVGSFFLTVGFAVVSEWALAAVMWAVGKASAGKGTVGATLVGAIAGGALAGAGMVAVLAADDELFEELWEASLLITAPVAGGSTIGGLIGYHASE